MKQKMVLKDENLTNKRNVKFNNVGSADENKYKISLQQFLPLSEAEIQGLLHPAEASLG
jgi:hypothetical protein